MKKHIHIYALPRQIGKTTRIIEKFIMLEIQRLQEGRVDDVNLIICNHRHTQKYIIEKINYILDTGSILPRVKSMFTPEWKMRSTTLIAVTSQKLKGVLHNKNIANVLIDEYEFIDQPGKDYIYSMLTDKTDELLSNVEIYTSLHSHVYLKTLEDQQRLHTEQPANLMYHPRACHMLMNIEFYQDPRFFDYKEKSKYLSLEQERLEYQLNTCII